MYLSCNGSLVINENVTCYATHDSWSRYQTAHPEHHTTGDIFVFTHVSSKIKKLNQYHWLNCRHHLWYHHNTHSSYRFSYVLANPLSHTDFFFFFSHRKCNLSNTRSLLLTFNSIVNILLSGCPSDLWKPNDRTGSDFCAMRCCDINSFTQWDKIRFYQSDAHSIANVCLCIDIQLRVNLPTTAHVEYLYASKLISYFFFFTERKFQNGSNIQEKHTHGNTSKSKHCVNKEKGFVPNEWVLSCNYRLFITFKKSILTTKQTVYPTR